MKQWLKMKGKLQAFIRGKKPARDIPKDRGKEPECAEISSGGCQRASDGCGIFRRCRCMHGIYEAQKQDGVYILSVGE